MEHFILLLKRFKSFRAKQRKVLLARSNTQLCYIQMLSVSFPTTDRWASSGRAYILVLLNSSVLATVPASPEYGHYKDLLFRMQKHQESQDGFG